MYKDILDPVVTGFEKIIKDMKEITLTLQRIAEELYVTRQLIAYYRANYTGDPRAIAPYLAAYTHANARNADIHPTMIFGFRQEKDE